MFLSVLPHFLSLFEAPDRSSEPEGVTDQMAAFLGVSGKKGVLVTPVNQGSPAASVLCAGDVILSIDGKPLAEPVDLSQAVLRKEPGSRENSELGAKRRHHGSPGREAGV